MFYFSIIVITVSSLTMNLTHGACIGNAESTTREFSKQFYFFFYNYNCLPDTKNANGIINLLAWLMLPKCLIKLIKVKY